MQPSLKTPRCTRCHSPVARRPRSHFQETSVVAKSARVTTPNCFDARSTNFLTPALTTPMTSVDAKDGPSDRSASSFGPWGLTNHPQSPENTMVTTLPRAQRVAQVDSGEAKGRPATRIAVSRHVLRRTCLTADRQAAIAPSESTAAILGRFNSLDRAHFIDPLFRIREAESKKRQLRLAQQHGLPMPRTLITNESRLPISKAIADVLLGEHRRPLR